MLPFLTTTAFSLEFNPMAFIENLEHMGVGMTVIFVVIGIIIGATSQIGRAHV